MLVFGTQIHIVTFVFIVLEFCMLIWQSARYFYRLRDKHRGWYCLLLVLLLFHNLTSGFFPDPDLALSVPLQHMISYGTTFLMAAYFPFYFYKEFDLKILRWHALRGAPLFLLLPYMVFFVIMYALNNDLKRDIRYGVIIPFIYSIILLRDIFYAIRRRYKKSRNRHFYKEELTVYLAILPWVAEAFLAWFQGSQLAEALCTNIGFLIITLIFFYKSALRARLEFVHENNAAIGEASDELFRANCLHYGLTKTEILIVQKIYKGMSTDEIAEIMSSSRDTVKKHIQNIFKKAGVRNRTALIHKLQNSKH
jgi:DNA-binding CsgD family transcriptional regulator